jgi:hypothetical protein
MQEELKPIDLIGNRNRNSNTQDTLEMTKFMGEDIV